MLQTSVEVYTAIDTLINSPENKFTHAVYGVSGSDVEKSGLTDLSRAAINNCFRYFREEGYLRQISPPNEKEKKHLLTDKRFLHPRETTVPFPLEPEPSTVEELNGTFEDLLEKALHFTEKLEDTLVKLRPILLDLSKDHKTYTQVKSLLHNMRMQVKV